MVPRPERGAIFNRQLLHTSRLLVSSQLVPHRETWIMLAERTQHSEWIFPKITALQPGPQTRHLGNDNGPLGQPRPSDCKQFFSSVCFRMVPRPERGAVFNRNLLHTSRLLVSSQLVPHGETWIMPVERT